MKLFYTLILSLFLITNLNAEEKSDNSVDQIFGLLGISKETQEKIITQSKIVGAELLTKSKEYSIQGKNILIEQTLQNGINTLVDTKKIKVEGFDINDTTNAIFMSIFLKGEDDILDIDIRSFDWGYSSDDKYIVFENLDISLNIAWLDYIVQNMINRGDGYIKVPKDLTLSSLLFSIKPNIKSTYKKVKKPPFDIVAYPYSKMFIDIKTFEVKDKTIKANIELLDSKDGLKFHISSYDLLRANKRTIIALKNITFKACNKPWIESLIKQQNSELHLTYTNTLYRLLNK